MLQRKLQVLGDGQLFQRVQLRLQLLHAFSDLPECLELCGLLRSTCKLLRCGRLVGHARWFAEALGTGTGQRSADGADDACSGARLLIHTATLGPK